MSTRKRSSVSGSPHRQRETLVTPAETSRVRKNRHGGVHVSDDEIRIAFEFLDADKTGRITLHNLKKRLGVFFPTMTAKEYRFLMNNKREITIGELTEMLINNELTGFDPVAEAFKAYDTEGIGYIRPAKLREVFANFGFGEITDSEMDILIKAADVDGDGIISQDDFRYMLDMHRAQAIVQTEKFTGQPNKVTNNTEDA